MHRTDYGILGAQTVELRTSLSDFDHGALGCATEAGELVDILKRYRYYQKEVDWLHVVEEAGDMLWYIAVLARAANVPLEQIAERNLAKLMARYPNKFSNEAALNRDLEKERAALSDEEAEIAGLIDRGKDLAEQLISHCIHEMGANACELPISHDGVDYIVSVKPVKPRHGT